MPRNAVSRTANVGRNGGHKWVKRSLATCSDDIPSNGPPIGLFVAAYLINLLTFFAGQIFQIDDGGGLFEFPIKYKPQNSLDFCWQFYLYLLSHVKKVWQA